MTQRASVILFAWEPSRRPLKNAIAQIAVPQLRPALGSSVAGKEREPPSLQARAGLPVGVFRSLLREHILCGRAGPPREPVRESRPPAERQRQNTRGEAAGVPALGSICLQGQPHEAPELSAELVLGFYLALAAKSLNQYVTELTGTGYLPVTDAKPSWQWLHT